MDKWQVSIPFEDVERMRTDKLAAEAEVAELKRQLAVALLCSGDGAVAQLLVDGMRSALVVIQWSQGNYDPETVRGWPHAELRQVAEAVKQMPGVTPRELEWAGDVKTYADMAAAVERARALGRQKELSQIPRSAIGSGYAGQVEQILQQPPKREVDPPPSPAREKAPAKKPRASAAQRPRAR